MTESFSNLSLSKRLLDSKKRLAKILHKAKIDDEEDFEEDQEVYDEYSENQRKTEVESQIKELVEQIRDLKKDQKRGEDVGNLILEFERELKELQIELQSLDPEEEIQREKISDQEQLDLQYKQISKNEEAHLFSLRNDPEYLAYYAQKLSQNNRREDLPDVIGDLYKNFPEIKESLFQALNLEIIEKKEALEEDESDEELLDPNELSKEYDVFIDPKVKKYYRQNRSLAIQAVNPFLQDLSKIPPAVERQAEQLSRAFFNYLPPSLIAEVYHVGQKKQPLSGLKTEFENQISRFERKDEKFNQLKNQLLEKPGINKNFAQVTFNRLEKIRESVGRLLKSITATISTENLKEEKTKEALKVELKEAKMILEEANRERNSLEEKDSLLYSECESVFAELLPLLNKTVQFLEEPTRQYFNTKSYRDWANDESYEYGEESFRQLFRLIRDYTIIQCKKQLSSNPNLKTMLGVQDEKSAESLATSVLYGIPLRTSETRVERELFKPEDYTSANYEYYAELSEEKPEEYQKKLNSFKTKREREAFDTKVEKWKEQRTSTDANASILQQIHEYLTFSDKKADMVCPNCSSSWWSFLSSSFPNASSFIFNDFVFPRAAGRDKKSQEAIRERTHELYTWRPSPFQAPVGTLSREGDSLKTFCGGIKEGTNADEVVFIIEEFAKKVDERKAKAQAILDKDLDAGLISKELLSFLQSTPFSLKEEKDDNFKLEFREDQIITITLPDCSQGDADRNTSLMKRALQENTPLKESVEIYYQKKEFVLAKIDFEDFQKRLEGKLCFQPKHASGKKEDKQPKSIADVINRSIGISIKCLTRVLPGAENERVVHWFCPNCETKNSIKVTPSEAYDLKNSPRIVNCTNENCLDRSHELSKVKHQLGIGLATAPSSLDVPLGEEGGTTAAELLEAKEEGPSQEEKQQVTTKKLEEVKNYLNQFGSSKKFSIIPSRRLRAPIQLDFPNLGEIIVSEILSKPDYLARMEKEELTLQQALSRKDLDLLPIVYKLGLILPFAVCKTCGSFHDSVTVGSSSRCALVEKDGVPQQVTVREAKRYFEKLQVEKPEFPTAHIPDFVKLEQLWNSQVRFSKIKTKTLFSADNLPLDESIEDFLKSFNEEKKTEESLEPIRKDLQQTSKDTEDTEDADSDIGLDLLSLDMSEEALDAASTLETTLSKETPSLPVEKSTEQEVPVEDLLSYNFEQENTPTKSSFDDVLFEKALALLPGEEKKKIEGSDVLTYTSGINVDKIPDNILDAAKKAYNTNVVRAIVDSPMENAGLILDEAFKKLQDGLKADS
jgi:hypothetical protein